MKEVNYYPIRQLSVYYPTLWQQMCHFISIVCCLCGFFFSALKMQQTFRQIVLSPPYQLAVLIFFPNVKRNRNHFFSFNDI